VRKSAPVPVNDDPSDYMLRNGRCRPDSTAYAARGHAAKYHVPPRWNQTRERVSETMAHSGRVLITMQCFTAHRPMRRGGSAATQCHQPVVDPGRFVLMEFGWPHRTTTTTTTTASASSATAYFHHAGVLMEGQQGWGEKGRQDSRGWGATGERQEPCIGCKGHFLPYRAPPPP
jgi:hypothetical protein